MASSATITYVTGNTKKLEETTQILGNDFPRKIVLKDIDLPEYQGEPEYIAREKCKLAVEHIKGPTMVEDVSLCFNALNGMPGPYIKSFLAKLKNDGLYKLLEAHSDKSAYALCIYAYCPGPNQDVILFQGRCNGTIVQPRGSGDFGWDPIFLPDGHDKTYAELPKSLKNKISHRGQSLCKMREYFIDASIGKAAGDH